MRFIEFARIHHWEEMLENACFRLENSCERFVNRAKMVPNKRKHNIFYALYEQQTQEIFTFSCIYTH